MRPSGLPNPRKLWGRIKGDLKKGDNISIDMIYERSNKEVKEGNTIFSNSKMPVNIMITYDNGPNTKEDVNVTIDNLTIEYEFKKSNQVAFLNS